MSESKTKLHTIADASRILGRSENTISKWLGQGCPCVMRAERRLLDISAVFTWRIEKERSDLAGGKNHDDFDFERERALLVREQRIAAQIKNELARGELLLAEDVADAWSNIVTNVKTKLLNMGKKVASQFGQEHFSKLSDLIEKEGRSILLELSAPPDS